MVYTIGRETVDAWDRERLRHSGVTHAKASHDCIMSPSDSPVPWGFWLKAAAAEGASVCRIRPTRRPSCPGVVLVWGTNG